MSDQASLFDDDLPDPARNTIGRYSAAWRGAPETQREAARLIAPVSGTSRAQVLRLIWEEPRTCDELEVILDARHQSISARVNDLKRDGWIVETDKRRYTRSGRRAVVWRVSDRGAVRLGAGR